MTSTAKSSIKSFLKFAVFLSFGLGILYLVYLNQESAYQLGRKCDPAKYPSDNLLAYILQAFSEANLFWLLMVCTCFMVSNLSRAVRWNLLIEPLGYRPKLYNSFFATVIGYFVNLAFPRAGELAKPATLSQYEKIPLDKLFGTIVADRVFDMLMLLFLVALAFVTQFAYVYGFLFDEKVPEPCIGGDPTIATPSSGGGIPWLAILGAVLLLGLLTLGIIWRYRAKLQKTKFYLKIKEVLYNFYEGAKTVFALKGQKLAWFFIHTGLIWLLYFLMMYICFWAYPPTAHLSASAALLAMVFGTFGIVVPSPGGIGTYQLAVTAALVIYGLSSPQAFAYSNIVFFTISIFCTVFFGIISYILLPILNRSKKMS